MFPIKRGTKQEDPLSSLLFNTVLHTSLEDDLKRWQEKQKDIRLSDKNEDCLTNLRFADDMLLFSTSLNKLEEMFCDFKRSTEAVGLGIHPSKTKILSNQMKVKKNEVTIDNIKIKVLQKATVHSTLDKKSRSRSKEQQKSKTELKRHGEHSTNIAKNLPRKHIAYAADYACSTL